MTTKKREILGYLKGVEASDGDGVKLRRYIGGPELDNLDPFLLLDVFGTDQPQDYIGGFPSHPHRGFETVTYLLAGRMRHKDNAGHEGVIIPGGVQWMTAGRGIIHSEMPEQEEGLLKGFQLWVNLPSTHKMMDPGYQEFPPESIPVINVDGVNVRLVAGELSSGDVGPVTNEITTPQFMDIELEEGQDFTQAVDEDHHAFVFGIEGITTVGEREIHQGDLAVLNYGDEVTVKAEDGPSRCLFVSGKQIKEDIVRGGPFVMNTRSEVLQAFDDYQAGRF
ncbi:quercetin 2,3-dioxygenase [Sneathiella sp. P13V-1]|uniref:pirin family protein n=1 Tax=Sneathiella sp. P13V-1 TaxID=2697366 RepID=UPI00187B9B2A|nr:pirin family protein [Sneathiella sp. P13V-1]MBE7637389.1 quercetin 2,3-dioxygenase [Sneathiella sp. P13V-1]